MYEFDLSFVENNRREFSEYWLIFFPLGINIFIKELNSKVLWFMYNLVLFVMAFDLFYSDNITREFNYYWFLIYISYLPLMVLSVLPAIANLMEFILIKPLLKFAEKLASRS